MDRRTLLRLMGTGIAIAAAPPMWLARLGAQHAAWPPVTVHGPQREPALVIANGGSTQFTADTIGGLVDRYRVVLLDLDAASPIAAADYTADRLCAAIFASLTGAGVDRFVWYGYSFGAVVGLQVAVRSTRVQGLICGGWPPLGAQYRETLAFAERSASRGQGLPQFATFYRSVQDWPERKAVGALTCARMVFAGEQDRFTVDGYDIHIAASVREHRQELEALGWTVELVDGFTHQLGARRDIIAPRLRRFMDAL